MLQACISLCLHSLHINSMKLEIIIVCCISEDQNFHQFHAVFLRQGVVNRLWKIGSSKTMQLKVLCRAQKQTQEICCL